MAVRYWIATLALLAGTASAQEVAMGKFTTAGEVRPILQATQGNWIAVREYEGQDLVYVTHLWSWRCGLTSMAVGLNGAKPALWPMPPCHLDYATPNAVLETDGLPFAVFPPGSVQQIEVVLTLDDGSEMASTFQRAQVRIP